MTGTKDFVLVGGGDDMSFYISESGEIQMIPMRMGKRERVELTGSKPSKQRISVMEHRGHALDAKRVLNSGKVPSLKKTSGVGQSPQTKHEPNEKLIVRKLTLVGILGNILLTALKLFAGIFGNSIALISDAVHSLSDVVATFVAFVGAKMARREADANHQFGHERFEVIAAVLLAVVLFAAAVSIGYTGILEIVTGEYEHLPAPTMLALVVVIISIVSKEAMYHYTMHYAKAIGSQAFEADAWHHRSDAISSVGALIGIGGSMLGYPIMDAIASVVICLILLKVAVKIELDAIKNMTDASRGSEYEERLRVFIEAFPDVEQVDVLRTRMFGSKTYIDLEIGVSSELSLVQSHAIAEKVHANIVGNFDDVKHVSVHVNPC